MLLLGADQPLQNNKHMTQARPATSGEPIIAADFKSSPEDFIVREQLGIPFDGQGEHAYLHVRKCGLNTHDILTKLESVFNVKSVDVGVSGLKDKNAITDQWFSVRTNRTVDELGLPTVASLGGDARSAVAEGEFVVLNYHRHSRKLRRGAHRANEFVITLKNVVALDSKLDSHSLPAAIETRLLKLQQNGFANYFGPQRFGIGGQNLAKAERYFANPRKKISRRQRGLLLSAARSHLFNNVCEARVRSGTWNTPLLGEPMQLHSTNSYFLNEVDPNSATIVDVRERCAKLDIHPSGPLWGEGDPLALSDCKGFEDNILDSDTSIKTGLANAGLKQQRRALRACAGQLEWRWPETNMLTIQLELLKGVYATSFLSEFMINSE